MAAVASASPDALRVRLLGGLTVEGVAERDLGSRKGRTLLKVLALGAGIPVSAERLVDALWGDDPPSRPTEQVGVLVSRLRGVLGADRIVRTDAGYRLVADWTDVGELHARVGEAVTAMAEERLGAARAAASAAVALARGELLPDEEGEWVETARALTAARVGQAHHVAAAAAAAAGDHTGAAVAAEAALELDPYDEVALRLLMDAHARAGRPASALAAYVRVRERVVDDLGVGLTAETEALHDRLVLEPAEVPAAAPPRRALVGRDAELGRLAAAFARAVQGGAALVVVRGEAGIGKSALTDAFVDAATDAVVLRGRCDELGRDLPLQPVADALADHLRGAGPDAAAALLGDDGGRIAPLLGWEASGGATTIADPEAGQVALFGALLAVLERIGGGGPVILALDDLHLAGASTLAWLAFACRRGRRLLLLATARPGGSVPGVAEVVELGPLDRDAAATLLPDLDESRLEALHERAAGNPLFLLALARSTEDELPASVRDAADAWVAALGEGAPIVRAAAVLGLEVDLDLVAEVLRRPAIDVLGPLEDAVAAGLLVERGRGFAFAHELVREALDAGAGGARRALVHRDAARALATRPDVDALMVAVHARLGGDRELAVGAYEQAAREASGRFDTVAAIEHLDAAVALGGSASVFAERARVRMATVQLDAAAADAAEAVARGGGAMAHEVAGWVAYYRRSYDDARAFAERGVEVAGDDLALRSSCQLVLGRILHGSGDLDGAAAQLGAITGAPPPVQGVADVWRGHVHMHEGQPGLALARLERPLRSELPLAHPWAGLHGLFARTICLGYQGRLADAFVSLGELDTAVAESGTVGLRFASPAGNARAWLLRWTGDVDAADLANQATLERTSAPDGAPLGDSVSEFHYVALLDLADGRMLAGDLDGAAGLCDRLASVDTWNGTMAWHQRHRLGLLRSRLALHDGDRDQAIDLAEAVAHDAAGRGSRRYELLARARVALAGGDANDLDVVVAGLGDCAALEGWRLLVELADGLGIEALRAEAARRVAALADAAGPRCDAVRAAAAGVLGEINRRRPAP